MQGAVKTAAETADKNYMESLRTLALKNKVRTIILYTVTSTEPHERMAL